MVNPAAGTSLGATRKAHNGIMELGQSNKRLIIILIDETVRVLHELNASRGRFPLLVRASAAIIWMEASTDQPAQSEEAEAEAECGRGLEAGGRCFEI